jgi:uncharacterized protein (DUF302 family)
VVEVLKKISSMNFEKTVKHLENTISEAGFSVLFTKSIDSIFKKKLNLDKYPRYTMILVCSPELAKMALDVSKDVGTLFPCSFVVYEDNGKVVASHISIMKIAEKIALASEYQMKPIIEKTKEMIHKVWEKF